MISPNNICCRRHASKNLPAGASGPVAHLGRAACQWHLGRKCALIKCFQGRDVYPDSGTRRYSSLPCEVAKPENGAKDHLDPDDCPFFFDGKDLHRPIGEAQTGRQEIPRAVTLAFQFDTAVTSRRPSTVDSSWFGEQVFEHHDYDTSPGTTRLAANSCRSSWPQARPSNQPRHSAFLNSTFAASLSQFQGSLQQQHLPSRAGGLEWTHAAVGISCCHGSRPTTAWTSN
jgi:hypothetical protein